MHAPAAWCADTFSSDSNYSQVYGYTVDCNHKFYFWLFFFGLVALEIPTLGFIEFIRPYL